MLHGIPKGGDVVDWMEWLHSNFTVFKDMIHDYEEAQIAKKKRHRWNVILARNRNMDKIRATIARLKAKKAAAAAAAEEAEA